MKVIRQGNYAYSTGNKTNYSFEVSNVERSDIEQIATEKIIESDWEDNPLHIDNLAVIPFGDDNNLPAEIRNTTTKHNLAPRIFTKKKFLTWGEGPMLYKLVKEDKNFVKDYVEDTEISTWLNSWKHEKYLRKVIEDFNHTEGHFTKLFRSKGSRIGKPFISKLEHLCINEGRLAYPWNSTNTEPTSVIVGKWSKAYPNKYKIYPIFNEAAPFSKPVSVYYSFMQAFATNYYTRPDVMGSLAWIRRSTAIPFILEALTNNSLNIKWHIVSPSAYWAIREEKLREQATADGKPYKDETLEDLKDEILQQLTKVLSGVENIGKFFHSESFFEIVGNTALQHEWKLIPIDQKIKDYVESQLEIAKRAQFETVAGLGLHPALSNIGGDGKSDSGSEQLYALKNYLLTEVHLPEAIICEAINLAIQLNWPSKKIKLGFYRQLPEREEDITSSKRITNAV